MQAKYVLRLQEWVIDNKQMIMVDAPTQSRLCELASAVLGVKVSANALRDVMTVNGLQTKRESQAVRKQKAMQEEIDKLRKLVVKLATACNLPEWLAEEIKADPNLTEDIKQAIRRNAA